MSARGPANAPAGRPWGRAFASAVVVAAVAAAAGAGCKRPSAGGDDAGPAADGAATSLAPTPAGDAVRGRALAATFECARCHEGTGHPKPPHDKQCVGCHTNIVTRAFRAPSPAAHAKWLERTRELADVPDLGSAGRANAESAAPSRLRRAWVEAFLLDPVKVRPNLHASMPRLALTTVDARDLAAYLAAPEAPEPADLVAARKAADLGHGRRILETRGCGTCHSMTGVLPLPPSPLPEETARALSRLDEPVRVFDIPDGLDRQRQPERARRLAPDLALTRQRMTFERTVAWLRDPHAVAKASAMPKVALDEAEVRDVAAYLHDVKLAEPEAPKPFERLPLLTRAVTFDEVDQKVFHRTCWHCHSDPDFAIGDGGPGNSGGFGFAPKKLNMLRYESLLAGAVDEKGQRTSVFEKDAAGTPRLVRVLLARHDEARAAASGKPPGAAGAQLAAGPGALRGMPLGYDPLSAEDIQLVESWIAQGRKR